MPMTMAARYCIVIVFGIAFAYIEAAVVVYLRQIFHPEGFAFPLSEVWLTGPQRRLLLVELGREAATIVLLLAGAFLFGKNHRQRFAYFMTTFAVWDIFYYIWLKVLIGWPGSIMDWDVLFLIPVLWAGPVLAPILVSIILLGFSMVILYRDCSGRAVRAGLLEGSGFVAAGLVVVVSFCVAGRYASKVDFASHFYWPLFGAGVTAAILLFVRCLLKRKV